MKKILILSITLLFLVVACEINWDFALGGESKTETRRKETEATIEELIKKIEVLERKQGHLRMIVEYNNGLIPDPKSANDWLFKSKWNTENNIDTVYPLTFDEFLELEDEQFNLIFEDLEYEGLERIGSGSSSGGGGIQILDSNLID